MSRTLTIASGLVMLAAVGAAPAGAAQTTFGAEGTSFIAPKLITSSSPTALKKVGYVGRRNRETFDRRDDEFLTRRVFEFRATYSGSRALLVRVNSEFSRKARAATQAKRYARVVGQLPTVLRGGLRTITIHAGDEDFGGGGKDIVIHIGRTASYVADGALEEILCHEVSHAVLDDDHASSQGWLSAQKADPAFISDYARDNPTREDVAESFVAYLAARYGGDRVDAKTAGMIEDAIPRRLAYFDEQRFDVAPLG